MVWHLDDVITHTLACTVTFMCICMYTHTCICIEIYEHTIKWATRDFSFPTSMGNKLDRMNRIKAFLSSLVGKSYSLPELLTAFGNPLKDAGVHMSIKKNVFLDLEANNCTVCFLNRLYRQQPINFPNCCGRRPYMLVFIP